MKRCKAKAKYGLMNDSHGKKRCENPATKNGLCWCHQPDYKHYTKKPKEFEHFLVSNIFGNKYHKVTIRTRDGFPSCTCSMSKISFVFCHHIRLLAYLSTREKLNTKVIYDLRLFNKKRLRKGFK